MHNKSFTPRKLIKLLRDNDFIFVRQSGSHAIFKNEQKRRN